MLGWSFVPMRFRLAILTALSSILLVAAPEDFEDKPIAGVQFVPENQPLSLDQLMDIAMLRVGQPLHALDIREAIQRLFKTGEYDDIAVDATLGDAGVNLKFLTTPNYFVGHVSVNGIPEPPNEGQLVGATKLQLGTDYSSDEVKRAVDRLVDVVRRNGFYHAAIEPQSELQAPVQQAIINFSIDAGKRARFDGLTATGQMERSVESIMKSAGWKRWGGLLGWHSLTESRLQSGLDSIRSWYPKHDRLLAKVTLVRLDYHPATNTVTPVLSIDSGPLVAVRLKGASLSGGKLRDLLPIYEERSVDRDLLEEGTRDLTAYFQSKGYFDARVSYLTTTAPNGSEFIDYDVDLGPHHKLVKLDIEGNHYFDSATLRERMSTIPATVIRYRSGRYSRADLERDLEAIRNLYRSNGFRDVEVVSREVDNYDGKKGQIAIFIEIEEGPQWFVSNLDLEGVSDEDRAALLAILHSTAGQPYSDANIASDRDSVLGYYFNHGYPEAKFEFVATPAAEINRMDLKYVATPGRRVYVRDVLLTGLQRTQLDLVRERISLKKGDPLSQERITGSQRRLYDLGIFARVDTALQNPDGEEPTKNVLYSMDEAGRYSMNVGFGAEIGRIGGGTTSLDSPAGATGFSPRFSFGVSRLNFLGLGHTIGLQNQVSTIEQRSVLTYLAPQFEGNPSLSLQFSGLFDLSHDVRTFSARREEGSVQLAEKLSKANTIQYRFTFRKVDILGTPLISPELIPLLSQPDRVGLIATTFIQDRRDDPVDSHRGVYNTVDFALATQVLYSQIGYGRVLARNSTYYPLTKSLVLARSTSFGFIERYSGLPEVPLPERFFGGGAAYNRAFPDYQAGPRDLTTGFPIGGNALFFNNIELRFPLVGDNLGGVLFNDIGNVYSSLSRISLRFRQRNLEDFDYAVQSFGFGIRYRTPIGPVRADFSLSPNSPRFFGFKGTEDQLLFGGGQQVVQRINVFQFHISIGQTF